MRATERPRNILTSGRIGELQVDTEFRSKTSAQLYRAAWTVEVVAVLMGLAISIAVGFDGWESLRSSEKSTAVVWMNILISAAPFFLVALVEITKIPMSGAAYYATRWYWKVMFTLGLIFVAFVTFETMFNGLERNFASLKYSMDVKMDEYTLLKEQSADLLAERSVAEELTLDSIEEAYNARLAAIYADFDKAVAAIDQRYESQLQATSDEFIQEKRADKERLNEALAALRQRQSAEIASAANRAAQSVAQAERSLDGKRRTIQQQYQAKSKEIDILNRQMAELGPFAFAQRSTIEAQLEMATVAREALSAQLSSLVEESAASTVSSSQVALRNRHQREIANLARKIEEVSGELEKALGERRAANENLNNTIATEKDPILRKREVQLAEAEEWRRGRLSELENRSVTIDGVNLELGALATAMTQLRGDINAEGRGNQVYRLAASFYDKDNIAELSPGQIALVATVWFGSLATIVACAGILLAFGSYAVKTEPRDKSDDRPVLRHLRMLIAAIKLEKRKAREIEVVKEVEVTKTVEVPGPERIVDREVKVREEVYIPVPATPSQFEALMKGRDEGVAEDMAA